MAWYRACNPGTDNDTILRDQQDLVVKPRLTMPSAQPSYVLHGLIGSIPILRDLAGRKFPWVPCQSQPFSWDEDAPISIRRRSAELCEDCPAFLPCGVLRDSLGKQARGVWAGQIMTRRGETGSDTSVPHPRRRRAKVPSPVTQPLPDRVHIIRSEVP